MWPLANDLTPRSRDARSEARSSMFLAAVMRAGGERTPVKVRNMSRNGALIETPLTPAKGTEVELTRGPLVAGGTVIWGSGRHCGLRFFSEVSVDEWLAAPTTVHQQRVDQMVALVRAGGISDATDLPLHSTRQVRSHEQLIDDLGSVISLIQDLEDDLASSVETLQRHAMKLQNLDIAMQILRAVAGVLTPGSNGATSMAELKDLRVSCAKALGGE